MYISRIDVINSIGFEGKFFFKKTKALTNDDIFTKIYGLPQIDPIQIIDDLIHIYEKVGLGKDIEVLIDCRNYMNERISRKLNIKGTCINNGEFNSKILGK